MVRVLRREQLQTLSVEADPVEVRVVGIASSFLTDGLEVDRPRVLVDAETVGGGFRDHTLRIEFAAAGAAAAGQKGAG